MGAFDKALEELANDQDFQSLSEQDQDSVVDQLHQSLTGKIQKSGNVLQNAINSSRINNLPITGTGMLPSNLPEIRDIGRAAFNSQVPEGWMGPMATGSSFTDKRPQNIELPDEINKMMVPETQYGKNLEVAAKIAPLATLGLEAGTQGINKLFNPSQFNPEIENIKGSIQSKEGELQDLIKFGPEKVKSRVGDIFNEFQKEFGDRLSSIKGGITNNHVADALDNTAEDLGASHIQGSPGNKAKQMAGHFRRLSTENSDRFFSPKEIQAQTKQILNSFGGDTLAKAKFYSHFTDVLSNELPELSNLKSEYSPVYDIANQSKRITSGSLGRVVSGKAGPQELGEMAQAQQMMNDKPNVVEQASAGNLELQNKNNQLQELIGKQSKIASRGQAFGKAAKEVGKGALFTTGAGAIGGATYGIYKLLKNLLS